MSPEERLARIRHRHSRMLNTRSRVPEDTAAFIREVEEAHADEEAGLSYRKIAPELGMSLQALTQLRDKVLSRSGKEEAAS